MRSMFGGGHAPALEEVTLLASAVRTVSANSEVVDGAGAQDNFDYVTTATFYIDLTAAATVAGDTLDVFIDRLLPKVAETDADVWDNIGHFDQFLGNGAAQRRVAHINAGAAASDQRALTDAAAGTFRDIPILGALRVRWTIVNVSAPSFTFGVAAHFQV